MAATFSSSGTNSGSGVTTLDVTMSVNVRSGALVASIMFDAAVTNLTLTWDQGGTNQAMTRIVTAAGGVRGQTDIWGLVAPTAVANGILRASWTTSTVVRMGAIAWHDVSQTGGNGSFIGYTAGGNDATPTITVTSAVGNAVMDCTLDQENTALTGNTQTLLFLSATGGVTSGGMSWAAGAASVALAWSISGPANWVSAGVNIVAGPFPTYVRVGGVYKPRSNPGDTSMDILD